MIGVGVGVEVGVDGGAYLGLIRVLGVGGGVGVGVDGGTLLELDRVIRELLGSAGAGVDEGVGVVVVIVACWIRYSRIRATTMVNLPFREN